MNDIEIKQYLDEHNWEVDAKDFIHEVLNRSYQIIDTYYDIDTGMMNIFTSDNIFTFKWKLHKIKENE